MSYKRTLVVFIIFVTLAASYYFYEIKGKTSREEKEQKAKLLLSFKPEDAATLVLKRPGEMLVVEKTAEKWRLTQPVIAPAEQKTVEQIVRALSELKYERELGPQSDIETFGLKAPAVEVEVKGAHADIGALLMGAPTPDGSGVYAKRVSDDKVYTIAKSTKDSVNKTLFDIRDKTVFDFAMPDVKGLAVSLSGQTIAFEAASEDNWRMTAPEKYPADADKIRKLLDSIKYSRIQRFIEEEASDIEKYGLSKPRASFELAFADDKKVLMVGDETAPDSGSVYARRDDQRQVFELRSDILRNLSRKADEWRDMHLARFNLAEVARVQVEKPDGQIVAERIGEGRNEWKLVEPQSAKADKDKIEELFTELLEAKAVRFLKASDAKTISTAFDNPLVRVTLSDKGGETESQLSLGKMEGKPEVYAKTNLLAEVSVVRERLLTKLSIQPEEFRDRSVLAFDPASIERIEVATKDKSFSFKRKEVEWKVPRGTEMQPNDVDQFLWDLRELEYVALKPAQPKDKTYGFDSPACVIRLWAKEAKNPVRLTIGKRAADKNIYYVVGEDERQMMEIEDTALSKWLDKFLKSG